MAKTLLVAATELEILPIKKKLNDNQVLITGMGVFATVFHLMKKLTKEDFDLVIHAGIGGAFDHNTILGTVFQISADRFADIGYETPNGLFQDFFGSELMADNTNPFENGWMINPFLLEHLHIPRAKGITVNTVSGCTKTIAQRKSYNAQIESMESAGLFYVCKQSSVKFLSLRAISNHVTPRNKKHWQIEKAIKNLNKTLDLVFE